MLSRRRVLRSGTAIAAASVLGAIDAVGLLASLHTASASEPPQGLIDMHCHIFNASDLPIQGYLRHVIFKAWAPGEEVAINPKATTLKLGNIDLNVGCGEPINRSEQRGSENRDDPWWKELYSEGDLAVREQLALAAADLCYRYIRDPAITAEDELKAMNNGSPPAEAAMDESAKPRSSVMVDFFSLSSPADAAGQKPPATVDERKRREHLQKIDAKSESGKPLLKDLLRKMAPAAPAASADEAGSFDRSAARVLQIDEDRIINGDNFLGRQIRWAQILKSRRQSLAEQINKDYDSGQQGRRFVLYAPTLIDYSMWLGDDVDEKSSLAKQGAVMAAIAVKMARRAEATETPGAKPSGARFHGYMAYDPLRDVKEKGDALKTLETALTTQGFIGAKLYPTMGFLPANNAGNGALTFSKRVLLRELKGLHPNTTVQNYSPLELAQKIDVRLTEFYRTCVRLDAPILAHATSSYGAGPNYECRAHPSFWKPVLTRHPQLRVCLGHYGDFAESLSQGNFLSNWFTSAKVDLSERALRNSWEWHIAEIIGKGPSNLYADISYFSEVMDERPSSDLMVSLEDALALLIRKFSGLPRQLVYGTDWLLLAREKRAKEHYQLVRSFLKRTFDKANRGNTEQTNKWLQAVFTDNAVRFLGLRKNDGARERLETFYRSQTPKLSTAWLSAFDKVE